VTTVGDKVVVVGMKKLAWKCAAYIHCRLFPVVPTQLLTSAAMPFFSTA
jgi:hypothetical protein